VKLLALDTSSIACSVALQLDDVVTERHEEQPREHTRLLIPMIRSLLEESSIELAELDAIVLGNGPGSFIGMRIAASVAQGLAYGSGLNIVPVSSLAAVAAQVFAEHDAAEVVVTQDAHMGEVYLGIFEADASGLPIAKIPERLQGQEAIVELTVAAQGQRCSAGFGWERYPLILEKNRNRIDRLTDVVYPRARYLLALGEAKNRAARSIPPEDILPAYLRQKVADRPDEPR
jgi:tRNA threonylcarbamoyladenosine biosynthesis protein TsaB